MSLILLTFAAAMRKYLPLILLMAFTCSTYAQQVKIVYYPNGKPQYILGYINGSLATNIFLAPAGDTIYKWDIPGKKITDYPITGEFLLKSEYLHIKAEMAKSDQAFTTGSSEINENFLPPPVKKYWVTLYTIFFTKCQDYTRVVHEGDFTISIGYKNGKQWGDFKKYHQNQLIVSGKYVNGRMDGIWYYYPYSYYPYYDITFFDRWGREWSYFYYVLPFFLILLGIYVCSRYINPNQYHYYFYGIILFAIATLILRLGIPFDRENIWTHYTIPAIWFATWHAMILLAIMNLFFSNKRTNTPPLVNIFCLFIGVSVSLFILFFKHLDF